MYSVCHPIVKTDGLGPHQHRFVAFPVPNTISKPALMSAARELCIDFFDQISDTGLISGLSNVVINIQDARALTIGSHSGERWWAVATQGLSELWALMKHGSAVLFDSGSSEPILFAVKYIGLGGFEQLSVSRREWPGVESFGAVPWSFHSHAHTLNSWDGHFLPRKIISLLWVKYSAPQ